MQLRPNLDGCTPPQHGYMPNDAAGFSHLKNLDFRTWYTGEGAEVDYVFMHGLCGDREATWSSNSVLWPRDLLPKDDRFKNSRIIGVGYDSQIVHWDSDMVTQNSLKGYAEFLCARLEALRNETNTSELPLVLIAHSLGGLVVAQATVDGEILTAGHSVSKIAEKVKGIVTLGTPFGGSKHASWGESIRTIWSMVRSTDKQTVKTLKPDSDDLKHLRREFPNVILKRAEAGRRIGVVFFYEKTKVHHITTIVSEEDASYEGVGEISGLHRNHLTICKFDKEDDGEFKLVKDKMLKLKDGTIGPSINSSDATTFNTIFRDNTKVINIISGRGDMNIGSQENHF